MSEIWKASSPILGNGKCIGVLGNNPQVHSKLTLDPHRINLRSFFFMFNKRAHKFFKVEFVVSCSILDAMKRKIKFSRDQRNRTNNHCNVNVHITMNITLFKMNTLLISLVRITVGSQYVRFWDDRFFQGQKSHRQPQRMEVNWVSLKDVSPIAISFKKLNKMLYEPTFVQSGHVW